MDDVVWVEELQAPQDVLGYPVDFKLSQGPAAVQLLQDRAALSGLHEQMDILLPEQSTVELSDVLVAEAGLEFHIGCFKVLHGDLWGWRGDVN